MKKLTVIFLSVFLLCGAAFYGASISGYAAEENAQTDRNDFSGLIITLLHPQIEQAVTNYYGKFRMYEIGDSDVVITERNGNVFKVKVTVDTFEGAHNDYFTEILTFTVSPYSVNLDNYFHCGFLQKKTA